MRHPLSVRADRRAPLALLAALALLAGAAACSAGPGAAGCPGIDQGTFPVALTLSAASCIGGGPAAGFEKLYLAPRLMLTVAFAESGDAAICTGRHDALPLTGTYSGDQVTASLDTAGGAVLALCSASCLVGVRQVVTGALVRDSPSGSVTGFIGTLVETDTPLPGADCGPCTGPCTATWGLGPPP